MISEDVLLNLLRAPYLKTDNQYILQIIEALIPRTASMEERELLAIFYIKCIKTNYTLYKKLLSKDKYNSYLFLDTKEVDKPTGSINLEHIYTNLKNLNIVPHTRDVGFIDTILITLDTLIEQL